MRSLRDKGLSYAAIGKVFGISRQRVHQVLSGYNGVKGEYTPAWRFKLTAIVFQRDNYRCQRCNSVGCLILHHIDGDDRNNKLENLLTLCKPCHGRLHGAEHGHKNCSECGKDIIKKNHGWIAYNRNLCISCYLKIKEKKHLARFTEFQCEICGKTRSVYTSNLEARKKHKGYINHHQRFCSRPCYWLSRKQPQ